MFIYCGHVVNILAASAKGEMMMALIKCSECDTEISSLAEKCPKCGHPLVMVNGKLAPQVLNKLGSAFLVIGFVMMLFDYWSGFLCFTIGIWYVIINLYRKEGSKSQLFTSTAITLVSFWLLFIGMGLGDVKYLKNSPVVLVILLLGFLGMLVGSIWILVVRKKTIKAKYLSNIENK